MSKIGKLPITIPSGVTLTVADQLVTVKGSLGELTYSAPTSIKLTLTDNVLILERKTDTKQSRALHGLARALVANMVQGVSQGFTKNLELVGTGYRARLAGKNLVLSVGYSHEIEYTPPEHITLKVEGTNLISITGPDSQVVGQVAAVIRSYRKPEPYKGKGIRYAQEVVRRKAGKAVKAAA